MSMDGVKIVAGAFSMLGIGKVMVNISVVGLEEVEEVDEVEEMGIGRPKILSHIIAQRPYPASLRLRRTLTTNFLKARVVDVDASTYVLRVP